MPSIPGFIGPSYTDRSLPVDAERSINLFLEKVEGMGAAEAILRRVPGKRSFAALADGPIRALFAQDNRAFCVAGTGLYELYPNGSSNLLGVVASDSNPAFIASNGQAGYQLFTVSGGSGYITDLRTNAMTGALGGGFPANARGAAYLDGYFFTSAGVAVHASDLENGLVWNAASKAQRSIASDDLQAIVVDDHRTLWLIGSKSSEPWYDQGLSPFAFTPIASAMMGHGGFPYAVSRFDNSVFMLGQNDAGDRYAFVIANGYAAQRVSTHAIEQAWKTYPTIADARTWVYSDEGHVFAVVTFPSGNATWVFDSSIGAWHERGSWNASTGQFDADLGGCHCYAFGRHLVGSRNSATVYELSMSIEDDDGSPLRWLRRSPHLQSERRRVYYRSLELIADNGVGMTTGQGQDPQVMLRLSDDGGRTWGPERWRSLGPSGAYRQRIRWNRLGTARDRVIELSGSDPVRTTLIDLLAGTE